MRLKCTSMVTAVILCMVGADAAQARPDKGPTSAVQLGIDVLTSSAIDAVAGKRVALITNASAVDANLRSTVDRLHRDPRVTLVRLFAPEHGLRGAAPAGRRIRDVVDRETGLSVVSLFGPNKAPPPETLADVDVLVFDIQDIGSRTYTYTTTMARSMRAARKAGIPFVVLDRPNPLGGLLFEGPILRRKNFSFVGFGPVPVSHGLTAGELASFYNSARNIGCDLKVIPMKGWKRSMTWADTGLQFVMTSPAIPHARNAQLYIATGMVGGVTRNVNEGVGTTLPFELIGAEWVNASKFAKAMTAARLPGVRFRPISYRPHYHRHRGKTLHGVQIFPDDLTRFRPLRTALTLLTTLQRLYPGRTRFRSNRNFQLIWGSLEVMRSIQKGVSADVIEQSWGAELEAFGQARKAHLLYR